MKRKSGHAENNVLLILDLDGTLIHEDGSHEDFSILRQLRREGVELCLASRNDMYHVLNILDSHGIRDLFTFVVADFRPKGFQVRDILKKYRSEDLVFGKVLFIDDYPQNIENVTSLVDCAECLLFGCDIESLDDVSNRTIN